jgi:hypothetical protein
MAGDNGKPGVAAANEERMHDAVGPDRFDQRTKIVLGVGVGAFELGERQHAHRLIGGGRRQLIDVVTIRPHAEIPRKALAGRQHVARLDRAFDWR